MREIKFRAWLKDAEEHVEVHELVFENGVLKGAILHADNEEVVEYIDGIPRTETSPYWDADDFVLEQFTGLHDKNGTEIYESDRVDDSQFDLIYIICFGESGFGTGWYIKTTKNGRIYRLDKSISNLEVISTTHDKGDEDE